MSTGNPTVETLSPEMYQAYDTLVDFVPKQYANGQRHMYELTDGKNGAKMVHVSRQYAHDKIQDAITNAYGGDADTASNALLADYGYDTNTVAEAPEAVAVETPHQAQHLRTDGAKHFSADKVTTEDSSYQAKHFKGEVKDNVVDFRTPTRGERHPKIRRLLGTAAGLLALTGIVAHSANEGNSHTERFVNAVNFPEQASTSSTSSSSTSTTEAPTTSTTAAPTAAEKAQTEEDNAAHRQLAEMGIGLDQVTRITNFDQNLLPESPIEAGGRSMNLGLTHNSNTLTVNSSLKLSVEVLSGKHGADRAELAKQSLLNDGYSQEEIAKITKGDFSSRAIYVYRLNTASATIKHTDYMNGLGKLAYDENRPVGANDGIMIAVEKANTDNASNSRIDCGPFIQTFEDVDVPEEAPSKPVTPPEETTTTTIPVTTTTEATTTTMPTTTTTEATTTSSTSTSTTSSTTSSTVPSTTETTGPKEQTTTTMGEVSTTVTTGGVTPTEPTTSTVPESTTASTSTGVTPSTEAPGVGNEPGSGNVDQSGFIGSIDFPLDSGEIVQLTFGALSLALLTQSFRKRLQVQKNRK